MSFPQADITATVHINVELVTIKHYCAHDDGTASWTVSPSDPLVNWNTVYLTGTREHMRAFADAILAALAEQPAEVVQS